MRRFYVSTYALSNKMKQVGLNPEVAVCAVDWFSGHGNGRNLGWVLDPKSAEIRLKLREAETMHLNTFSASS